MQLPRALIRSLAFVFGVYLGVALIIVADVQLTLAALDPADPSTWPSMGPYFRYFVIPIGGTAVLLASLVLDAVIGRTVGRELRYAWHYLLQGMSYSLLLVFFLLSHIAHGPWSLAVALPLTLAVAAWVRRSLGAAGSGAGA